MFTERPADVARADREHNSGFQVRLLAKIDTHLAFEYTSDKGRKKEGQRMASPTSVLGAAGEHYVMCQPLRRGLIAALAPLGVPYVDIVVTDDIGASLCAIQVKTWRELGGDGGWHMSRKHESIESPNLFYAFLDFGKDLVAQPAIDLVFDNRTPPQPSQPTAGESRAPQSCDYVRASAH
ncbi:MAG: hypothetical protein AB7P12_09005 [Alphaproteobacteria bacterium]